MPTKIEWTDETWNPITGCSPASIGCKNCYARRMSRRLAGRHGYPEAPHHFDVTFHPDRLGQPLKWKKPRKIFLCSMSDIAHEDVLIPWLIKIGRVMKNTPYHTYQILTKRTARLLWIVKHVWGELPNVWLGVTAENQEQADKRIPILLQIPATRRFVSIEPMLDLITLYETFLVECDQGAKIKADAIHGMDWVIVGAETGPGARKMDLNWARSIRDQCQAAGVPFFFKKDSDGSHELDGRVWEEFPE